MKASILGANLDVGNRGVRALGVSVAGLFAADAATAQLSFHYGAATGGRRPIPGLSSGSTVTVRNHRLALRSRPGEHILVILLLACLSRLGLRAPARRNAWLRAIADADVIGEIRGGDSFSDIYGFRRFAVGSLPLIAIALFGRPYVLLPQTYGPFRHRSSRLLARFMLSRARTILTRDAHCTRLVEQLCGRTPTFCPDVAFTLAPREPESTAAHEAVAAPNGSILIGLNVSGLLYMGGYTGRNMFGLHSDYKDVVDALAEGLLANPQVRLVLVPHVFGSEHEEEACRTLQQSFDRTHPGRVRAVTDPLTEQELKWVIGQTQFFIGARMHACIAALSQGIPTIGLAYSDKFAGVFESAGVGESVVDLRRLGSTEVVRLAKEAIDSRDDLRRNLDRQMPRVTSAIRATFASLSGRAVWPPVSGARP
jgi:polysaccharide pyruvyl transferase WcaK-like protein